MNISIEDRIINLNKKYYWIVSALLAILFTYIGFSLAGMLSGGWYVIERGDLLESHVAYIKMLCRHLMEGESIWYSFDISMGMNTSMVLAYDTFSPFNVLFILFNGVDNNIIVTIIILLKVGLAASFFQLFSRRVLKVENVFSILFSLCYALCGFSVAYGTYHIMYLDGFFILPLLCLLITKAVDESKFFLLSLCYSYLFISNFYIGYMVGIFSLIFFVMYFIYSFENHSIKHNILTIALWVFSVLTAILISAVVWVPTLHFILSNYISETTGFPESTGITIMEAFNSLFWGQYIDVLDRHSSSYCGLLVVLLLPFYFFNRKVAVKERILSGIILTFLVLCYVFIPFYMFIHAFDVPDFYYFRFSFLFSFFLCSLATRQSIFIQEISIKKVFAFIWCLLLFYSVEQRLERLEPLKYSANDSVNLFINVVFLFGWLFLLICYQRFGKKSIVTISLLLIFFLGIEEISNFYVYMDGKTEEHEYYGWEAAVKESLEVIHDAEIGNEEFYRIVIDNDLSHDSDSLFGYNGISDFGTAENYALRKTMSNLGFGTSPRLTLASGYNPVSSMILGIKYIVKIGIHGNNHSSEVSLYEQALNLGYMVDDGMDYYTFPSRNVFINMNDVLKKMTGLNYDCFTEVKKDDVEYLFYKSFISQEEKTGKYGVEIENPDGVITIEIKNNHYDNIYTQFQFETPGHYGSDYSIMGNNYVNGSDYTLRLSSATQLSYNPESDKYYTYILADEDSMGPIVADAINYYDLHQDIVQSIYDNLSQEQLVVEKYKAGYIKGRLSVRGDRRLLLTTIPYDSAWKVWINGVRADAIPAMDNTFIAIRLPDKGDYEIEMKYEAPGVRQGTFISIAGVVLLVLYSTYCVIDKKKKTRRVNAEMEERDEK